VERIETDILVIGAGSGGLSVAAGASQMGADVVLLEGHLMGGDCLNYGCVPSKALLASARAAHSARGASPYGVAVQSPEIDYAAAKDRVADVIDTIAPVDSQERFEGLGVRVIRAFGRFTGPTTVAAGEQEITARRIVIATGSRPVVPPIPGLSAVPYLTNETLFAMRTRPAHLLVLGGGPVGLEMAQAHARLGSRVTVIEGARALGREDPEAAAVVLERLRAEGIGISEGAMAASVRGSDAAIEVTARDGRVFRGSHILVALGREAVTDTLDLDAAGIETTSTGIKVDARLRTTNRKVYAIGDVAGGLQFTHVAGYQAGIVIRSALFGLPSKARTDHIPRATYTDPELAQVGLTEAEARGKHGAGVEVVRADYAHNDRAIADGRTTGFVKIMVVRGRPVGATIVGHMAGELVNTWALVLAKRMKIGDVAGMVSPYPTYGELNKRAAGAYFSPRLFESPLVKRVVRTVQKWMP
jgi:pyruvate/2-oxoglutarate dehydrogenase complex dihydrolipoamide dehydrogenase (E3) component